VGFACSSRSRWRARPLTSLERDCPPPPRPDFFLSIVFSFYKTDESSLVLIGAKKVIHLLKNFKYIYLCDSIMVFSREPDDQLLGVVSSFAV